MDSKSSTIKPKTPSARQSSNLSARSQSSVGSPRSARKPLSANRVAPNGVNKTASSTTPKSKTHGPQTSTPINRQERSLRAVGNDERRLSTGSAKNKIDSGNRRPEKKTNGTTTSQKAKGDTAKTASPRPTGAARRVNRDLNRNSPREKPIRSDSSDIETAAKLVSNKVYELRTQLTSNSLITAPLNDFIHDTVGALVVLPLGRFSRNSQSLWRAAMMELLIEIAVPKWRVFLDPSLIELEKESLRNHSFLHRGDPLPSDVELNESVRAPGVTLFFIPQPDLTAVENLLKVNDDKLHEILIIGYSLTKLSEQAGPSSYLQRSLSLIVEEKFPFDLFPQTAFTSVFSDLRGHRFKPKSGSREIRAASLDDTTSEMPILKAAVSAPNLGPERNRVQTTLLTIGAICCGAGLAWMFINKR